MTIHTRNHYLKTLKYCPFFPTKPFSSIDEVRAWVKRFVEWYNEEHMHSRIKFVTPSQRHQGLDNRILNRRKEIYEIAKTKNPFRWSGKTRNWEKENKVYLNP